MEQLSGPYTLVIEDCIKRLVERGAKLSELTLERDSEGNEVVVHRPSGLGFRVEKLFFESDFRVVAHPEKFGSSSE